MEPDEAIEALSALIDLIDDDVPSHAWDKAGEFFEDVRESAVKDERYDPGLGRSVLGPAVRDRELDRWREGMDS